MEREIILSTGEVVRYQDSDPQFMLLANGGKPLGRPPSEVEAEWEKKHGKKLTAIRVKAWRLRHPARPASTGPDAPQLPPGSVSP